MTDFTPRFIPNYKNMCYYDSVFHLLFSIPEVRDAIVNTNPDDFTGVFIQSLPKSRYSEQIFLNIESNVCESLSIDKSSPGYFEEIARKYKSTIELFKDLYNAYITKDTTKDQFNKVLDRIKKDNVCIIEKESGDGKNDASEIMTNIIDLLNVNKEDLSGFMYTQGYNFIDESTVAIDISPKKYFAFETQHTPPTVEEIGKETDGRDKYKIMNDEINVIGADGKRYIYTRKGIVFYSDLAYTGHYFTILHKTDNEYYYLDDLRADHFGKILKNIDNYNYKSDDESVNINVSYKLIDYDPTDFMKTSEKKTYPKIQLYEYSRMATADEGIPTVDSTDISPSMTPTGINSAIIPTVVSAVVAAAASKSKPTSLPSADDDSGVSTSPSGESPPPVPTGESPVTLTQPALENTLFTMILDLLDNRENTTSFTINAYDKSGVVKEYTVALDDNKLTAKLKSPSE